MTGHRHFTRRFTSLAAAAVWSIAVAANAKVFLTQEEALKLVFPGAKIERKTFFLTSGEQDQAAKLSAGDKPSALAVAYIAMKEGQLVGTAYFDTHVVRTQQETLMVAIDPQSMVLRIEVLSFSEPEEYLPKGHWYGQFQGKKLDDDMTLSRGIRAVSGATLTARATTQAARRALALHAVLSQRVQKAA